MTDTDRNGIIICISRVYSDVNEIKGPEWYDFRVYKPVWNAPDDYYLIKKVGYGKYSSVFKAYWKKKVDVAVKILVPLDPKRYIKEIMILNNLAGGPNIVKQMDLILDPITGIYSLVSEWVNFPDWKKLYQSFTIDEVRLYLYKLLIALEYTHSNGIMHRDIKPANIAVDRDSKELRLLDWGLADYYHPRNKYSSHVGTRAFKPPEVLFEYPYYDYSMDIWSSGITLTIMLFRSIVLKHGSDDDDQLIKIADILGGQDIIDYAQSLNMKLSKSLISDLKKRTGKGWESFANPNAPEKIPPDAFDILNKMTIIDHRKRITAKEAMMHPFFDSVREKK